MKNDWNSEQDAVLTDGCIDCFDCTETVEHWTSDLFRCNKTLGPNHLVAHRSTCMTAIQNFWKCQNFRGYDLVPLQLISAAHQVQKLPILQEQQPISLRWTYEIIQQNECLLSPQLCDSWISSNWNSINSSSHHHNSNPNPSSCVHFRSTFMNQKQPVVNFWICLRLQWSEGTEVCLQCQCCMCGTIVWSKSP